MDFEAVFTGAAWGVEGMGGLSAVVAGFPVEGVLVFDSFEGGVFDQVDLLLRPGILGV